jgi:hypothetical protein
MPLKLWIYIGLIVGCLALGFNQGVNVQKGRDAEAIAQVNQQIADNIAQASKIERESTQQVIALQQERDAFKTKLQQEHLQNVKNTNDLRTKLSSTRLRFSAKNAGCGDSGKNNVPTEGDTASDASPAQIELPEEIANDLRGIAYDCDTLKDDYTQLYDFVWGQ